MTATAASDPVKRACISLGRKASDPRLKLFGIADDLLLVAQALEFLQRELVRVAVAAGEPSAGASHLYTCECRDCCLARIAES